MSYFSCFFAFIAHRYSFLACHTSLGRRYEVCFTNTLITICSRVELCNTTSSTLAGPLVIDDKIFLTALCALGAIRAFQAVIKIARARLALSIITYCFINSHFFYIKVEPSNTRSCTGGITTNGIAVESSAVDASAVEKTYEFSRVLFALSSYIYIAFL